MNIDALRSFVNRDCRSSVSWALLSLAASGFSIYAYSGFEAGPLSALMLKARLTINDFEGLVARGQESKVWIEVVNSGGGDSASDTRSVRVYSQERSPEPSIIFEAAPTLAARDLKLPDRRIVSLLRRSENRGIVAVLVEDAILIPNGRVRYLGS